MNGPTHGGAWVPRWTAVAGAVLIVAATSACQAPAPMALRYTTHIEVSPADDMSTPDMLSQMVPGGAMDMTTTLSDLGIRMEWRTPLPGLPANAVMLHRPDGSMILLDPATEKHWTIAIPSVMAGLGAPDVTLHRTGEQMTMAGVPADRFTFEIRVPVPPVSSAPTASTDDGDEPAVSTVTLTGETWVAPQFQRYTSLASAELPLVASLGLDVLAREGLQMKQVLTSPAFGGRRVEATVTAVTEEPLRPEWFEIPSGYTPGGELSAVVR